MKVFVVMANDFPVALAVELLSPIGAGGPPNCPASRQR
jgi:hypothetical protein